MCTLETEEEEEREEQVEEGWNQDDCCSLWGGGELLFCAASWLTTWPLSGSRLVLIRTSRSCSFDASAPAKSWRTRSMYPKKNSTFVDRSAASSSPTPPVPAAAAVACWKRSNSCRSNLRSAVRESFSSCCCFASASTTDDAIREAEGVKGVQSMLPRPCVPGLISPPAAYLTSSIDEVKGRILLEPATDLPPRTWACCSCCWCWYCCLCWC